MEKNNDPHQTEGRMHMSPSSFERRLLVFFKRYKSLEEIPKLVPRSKIIKVRDLGRIYATTAMMGLAFVALGYAAYSGKKEAEAGVSIDKMIAEYHRKYNEETSKK